MVNGIIAAPAIKLLYMAQQYQLGRDTKKIKTEKKGKQVTRVVKTSKSLPESVKSGKGSTKAATMKQLRSSGSVDDAANAFLAGFKDFGDD